MFQVIHIDKIDHHPNLGHADIPEPAIGEICEVTFIAIRDGCRMYELRGYEGCLYDAANFAPIDGPNEMEIVAGRRKKEPETQPA